MYSPEELADRAAITDTYYRYARGIDRLDEQLVMSAFHEDAIDYHGPICANPRDFFEWYLSQPQRASCQHYISNFFIELDGDVAHCEAYYTMIATLAEEDSLLMTGGRYVDRFERRDGEWRIAHRVLVREWTRTEPLAPEAKAHTAVGAAGRRDREDVSYERPLATVKPD